MYTYIDMMTNTFTKGGASIGEAASVECICKNLINYILANVSESALGGLLDQYEYLLFV